MRSLRFGTCTLALIVVGAAAHAQQPRDYRAPVAGQGRIVGTVSDAHEGRPLRRARVALSGSELTSSRTVITGDDGRFVFDGLPGGRYSLSASKDGHVMMNYGAGRPGRPGRVLTLAPGASIRADLRLPPGSVITGTVLTPEGEPASGVNVSAYTSGYDSTHGERRLSVVPDATVTTDDRGVYRIFGLAEGTYFIAAVPRLLGNGDVRVVTPSEVRSALAEVRQARFSSRPGIPAPPQRSTAEPVDPRKSVTFTQIFYPGTPLGNGATAIALRAGEVRHDVNIELQYVATSIIEGSVTVQPGTRVQLRMASTDPTASMSGPRISSASEEGYFSFRSVPPGSYAITARAFALRQTADALMATNLWGETRVVVAGEDLTGITVTLKPTLSIAGRIVYEGNGLTPPGVFAMRVPIPAFAAGGGDVVGLPSAVVDGARFSISNVLPGAYLFRSPPRGIRAPIGPWWLKSLVLNGREMLDGALDLRESTDDAVMTFSSTASELSGVVRNADGTVVDDGFVVVFPVESRFWFHNSRRIAGLRLSSEGKYVVRNLPAGEYLIAVTSDIDMNEWFDPEMLKVLGTNALRFSLAENEVRTLDLSPKR